MNFNGFDTDSKTKDTLKSLDNNGRLPHALILEGADKERLKRAAEFLAMYAVCTGENKPCGECAQCVKARMKSHADVNYPTPSNKSNTYSIEQMRDIIKDAHIIPNEADAKVYVFEEADLRFSAITQNSFLKLLEEPPKNVYFFLLCENAQRLLITILSRCTLVKISGMPKFDEASEESAKAIIKGILSSREYELMFALRTLNDKQRSDEVFTIVKQILRDAAAVLSGANATYDSSLANLLAARFTKLKLIKMLELCDSASLKIKQNTNINLLTTWLCGEYRRISWQR